MTGIFLFWLILVNWALVGTFCFISIPFDDSFWSMMIHFASIFVNFELF